MHIPSPFPARALALAGALLALASASAAAQVASPLATAEYAKHQSCVTIADTARTIPTPGQIRERLALRDTLLRIGRRFGVREPAGLLFVAVDTGTMHGKVRFLETNLPDTAVALSTRLVERYLSELQPGRGFQMLVRIDGEYLAPAAGRRLCNPGEANDTTIRRVVQALVRAHPREGRPAGGQMPTAMLRLVVNRTGQVAFVHVERPTGDPYYDGILEELARHVVFYPARLDGVPFDMRIRYAIAFPDPDV
jgi:hypothetical protein